MATKQDKYTKSARGQMCLTRIHGVCKPDPATTVFAHRNGGGMAIKRSSIDGSYACHACHEWLDHGWTRSVCTRADRDLLHFEAIARTQEKMIRDGVLVL